MVWRLLQGTDCMTVKWTGGRRETRSVSLGSIGSAGARAARRREREGAQSFPGGAPAVTYDGGADSLTRQQEGTDGDDAGAARGEQPAEVKADGRLLLLLPLLLRLRCLVLSPPSPSSAAPPSLCPPLPLHLLVSWLPGGASRPSGGTAEMLG